MPYEETDPRSQLATLAPAARPSGAAFPPQYFEFGRLDPDERTDAGSESWLVRSQTCAVVYSRVQAGDVLRRADQPDEYVVLFPSADAAAVITSGTERTPVTGRSVAVVPAGPSEIEVTQAGEVVRIFSNRATDVLQRCRNAAVYAEPDPNVAPFRPWPDPPTGPRVRVYPVDAVEPDPSRFGRLFRCSTVMVNYFYPDDGARDPSKLSPHHHDDFEQISLQLVGDYVHHMRTPWTVNLADWRDDEHHFCASPAVTVIPPPIVHTSQSVGDVRHQLIDIFCPPRVDFSLRPGWVLNADEYPMP
jgi:hypothetical protein